MKTCKILCLLLPLVAALPSCDDFGLAHEESPGTLRWNLDRTELPTKAAEEIPDTNDFILSIFDAAGKTLYEGAYGNSPEYLDVTPGYYSVEVVSARFETPAFSSPQYGDRQVVQVASGQSIRVRLHCTLQNAGIRLKADESFLSAFPDGVLYVRQGDVKLKYLYRESRIAYVKAGEVAALLYSQGQFETLFTRSLEAREILCVSISAAAAGASGKSSISIQTDTSKVWLGEQFVIGGQPGGDGAIPVGDVPAHLGEKGVWVHGYIVGGDLTSAGKNVKTSDITKNTHLALADRSSVNVKASCLAVELPKGTLRDALNLVDHPELIGTRVYVKGNLVESYYGTHGMKGTSDHRAD